MSNVTADGKAHYTISQDGWVDSTRPKGGDADGDAESWHVDRLRKGHYIASGNRIPRGKWRQRKTRPSIATVHDPVPSRRLTTARRQADKKHVVLLNIPSLLPQQPSHNHHHRSDTKYVSLTRLFRHFTS